MTEARGSDHWYTLDSARFLAVILLKLDRLEEAEASLVDLLSKSETILGINHKTTLDICHCLAGVFRHRNEYVKAKELLQRSYRGNVELYGLESENTLMSLMNLAVVTDESGDYEHALEFYAQALQGYENILGPDHPDTTRCKDNRDALLGEKEINALEDLAESAVQRGYYDEALEIWDEAVQKSERLFGPDDTWSVWCRKRKKDVPVERKLRSFDDQIRAAESLRNYDQSLEIYDQAIHKCEISWGPDDFRTLRYKNKRDITSYEKFAEAAADRGDYDQAIDMFDQAIRLCEDAWDADHPWILFYNKRRETMARISARKKRKEITLEMYDKALDGIAALFRTGVGETAWCETDSTGESTQEMTL